MPSSNVEFAAATTVDAHSREVVSLMAKVRVCTQKLATCVAARNKLEKKAVTADERHNKHPTQANWAKLLAAGRAVTKANAAVRLAEAKVKKHQKDADRSMKIIVKNEKVIMRKSKKKSKARK